MVAAKAEAYTQPVDYSAFFTCMGETLHIVGELKWVEQVTIDSQGGAHIGYHGHGNMTGIGEESGLKYQYIWNNNNTRRIKGPGPWEFQTIVYDRFIGQRTGKVMFARQTWLTTISKSGEWSSYLTDFRFYCEGDENS